MPLPENFDNCLEYCPDPCLIKDQTRFDQILDRVISLVCEGPVAIRRLDVNGQEYQESIPNGPDAVIYRPIQNIFCGAIYSEEAAMERETRLKNKIKALTQEELRKG